MDGRTWWTVLAILAVAALWALGISCEADHADTTSAEECGILTLKRVGAVLVVWGIGFAAMQLSARRRDYRPCPRCGTDVRKGETVCRRCGFDFSAVRA